ncbi:MAG: hypothetical protein A4E49_01519 [Methanosaeta sp. PtaU1.Bin112]|nr:MAG: hypothetical protein A4E49_01519 [Methanosaeta sp. PtaU1.Bin112]
MSLLAGIPGTEVVGDNDRCILHVIYVFLQYPAAFSSEHCLLQAFSSSIS